MYTAPDPSTTSTSQDALRVPERPKLAHVDLVESGTYCNDVANNYKALSVETKDYMNLYATTDHDSQTQHSDSMT